MFVPVLAGILVNEQGKIFLAQRKSNLIHGGKWEFPGGKLHPQEQPATCLQRELREEFGVESQIYHPFDVATYTTDRMTIVLIAYWAKFVVTPTSSIDHQELRWVAPGQVLQFDLTPADVLIAQKLQQATIPVLSNS